jgi:hypothetical protein
VTVDKAPSVLLQTGSAPAGQEAKAGTAGETETALMRLARARWWMRFERSDCVARGVHFALDAIGELTGINRVGLRAREFVGEFF